MSNLKPFSEKQLEEIVGGVSYGPGFYYGISYKNKEGIGHTVTGGPFESLDVAKAKAEEKKAELTAEGCTGIEIQVIYWS